MITINLRPGQKRKRAGNPLKDVGERFRALGTRVKDPLLIGAAAAWVIVAGGEVEIEQGGSTVSGGPGLVAHFDPKERHEVRAASDARVLLFLAPWPGEGHPSQR